MKRLAFLLVLAGCAGALPAQAAAPLGRVQVVAHNLTLRKVGTTKVTTMPGALPGTRETATLRLKPGLYVLKCTMADHALRGMKARLRVRPRT
ncbi:MAG: hypothetical protein E6G31_09135 [Actinobacteria bacterium]|nr:MAG: hypothetical protein E6G31_09135 [Actinomycetota bacterium]